MITLSIQTLLMVLALKVSALNKQLTIDEEQQIRVLLNADDTYDEKELAHLGAFTPAVFPLYCRILDDPDEHRYIVARTLYTLSIIKADRSLFVDRVVAKLTSPHNSVRRGAVQLLAQIGSSRDAAPVVALLSDTEWTIPFAAAKTLVAIGDQRTLVAMDVWMQSDVWKDDRQLREHVLVCRDELKARLDKEKQQKEKPPGK